MDRAATPDMVRLLWDVCQIPDFRKIMPDHHTSFLHQVYLHLAGEGGQLDETWVKTQIDRLTSTAGDIDALTGRLADIRTWTYISHRATGSRTRSHWQARTRCHRRRAFRRMHETADPTFCRQARRIYRPEARHRRTIVVVCHSTRRRGR